MNSYNINQEINVIIEISAGSTPVKYETDHCGIMYVDRLLQQE